MKRKTIIQALFTAVILLSACQKSTDIFVPDSSQTNGPDTTWQTVVTPSMPVSDLKNNLLFAPYSDTIIVNANIASVITPFGVQVNFPPNCCVNAAGTPLTGKVLVELQVIKKKGDMIRLNRPSTSNDSLQVTAGEIFITLKKDGVPVLLAPNAKINIKYVDLPINPLMKFFVGDDQNPQQFNWLPNPDPANNFVNIGSQAYEIYTNHLRWISVAYNYSGPGTGTVKVAADLAPYFTNANTVAFTVFHDFRSVTSMHGDLSTRKFMSPLLPLGKVVTVVVISKQVNDYYLGYETAVTTTPTSGNGIQPVFIRPVKKSLPEILAYLSTL